LTARGGLQAGATSTSSPSELLRRQLISETIDERVLLVGPLTYAHRCTLSYPHPGAAATHYAGAVLGQGLEGPACVQRRERGFIDNQEGTEGR
jgi:hypothetical protein